MDLSSTSEGSIETIVSDAGPIIALLSVDRLDLLGGLFSRIIIPDCVMQELLEGGPTLFPMGGEILPSRFILGPPDLHIDPLLNSLLGGGEAATVQQALASGSETVLIDERKARRIARDVYGLRVIGTARVLVEAKRRGLVSEVCPLMLTMRETGYWIHDSILQAALIEVGEKIP